MCDYSLLHVANAASQGRRQAGDDAFQQFDHARLRGGREPDVAVCLLPGTEIAFDENVECEPSFGIGMLPNKKIGQRLARFRQVNLDNPVHASRCAGISRRTGGAADAPVRRPARDGTAITCRHACRNCGEDRRRAAASGDLAFDLIAQTDTR